MTPLHMVDLSTQYAEIKEEIDSTVLQVIGSTRFIGGPEVIGFSEDLGKYLGIPEGVVPCANGTDALQIACMALDLKPGDEVIVPAFTYVATAEVLGLLGLIPVMADVDLDSFNIRASDIEPLLTERTKAIVPVHLFGQSCDMEPILELAKRHNLFVIEDNAQAIGADYTFPDGTVKKTGTMGHVGCTSFFPSKNLGCYGDGGAMMATDAEVILRLRRIANHGQNRQYYHDELGVNSRLDAIQAAILRIKLRHLNRYNASRMAAAEAYNTAFSGIDGLITPSKSSFSSHVYHQYTLRVTTGERDALKAHLDAAQIPCMVYYPLPLHHQPAYSGYYQGNPLPNSELLCKEVISLPMHSEHTPESLSRIIEGVVDFFSKK